MSYRIDAAATVFNPYAQLDNHIAVASHDIASVFSKIDKALDKGKKIRSAVKTQDIEGVLKRTISSARLAGFQHAAGMTKKAMPPLYGRRLANHARRRALRTTGRIDKTTRRVLKNTPDSLYVLSPERAQAAARYEASKAYFKGVSDGFSGTGFQKSWITSSAEACDDCQGNEDQGPIDVDDVFDSGNGYPTQHINCSCYITVRKTK